ncbi:unnamed protein product [Adineta steineri]|uniref:CCHC-type domain-containing protein n=1 Tax=Adineta steineri TaxID=433720 RepID=A0A814T0V3_9BILA|nr:unnamed protein product [Adineta steineri]CAF1341307.1 unnamed protein product [Adineta steineri]
MTRQSRRVASTIQPSSPNSTVKYQDKSTSCRTPSTSKNTLRNPTSPQINNLSPVKTSSTTQVSSSGTNNSNKRRTSGINHTCSPIKMQQPIVQNIEQVNQQTTTSINSYSPTINSSPCPQYDTNDITDMEDDNNSNFTLVKHKQSNNKNKKAKTDSDPKDIPSSVTTIISNSANVISNSTSFNTASIIATESIPTINDRTHPPTDTNYTSDTSCNPNEISEQALRFAETRYAFPAFVIKFNIDVIEKNIIQHLMKHFTMNYNFDIALAGHRMKNKRELILFASNRESFAMLYDDQKWPNTIDSLMFIKIKPSHLPPQFSLMLRNVPVDMEVNDLLLETKNDYPEIISAHRITNKYNQPTTFVRIDINKVEVIEELRSKKYIYVNYIRITVTEYLAPAKVLVCNKCFRIGHFRSTCPSKIEYCRTCGEGVTNINEHKTTCNKIQCCIRCKGSHDSNDVRCPDIKIFRSALTKVLLDPSGAKHHYKQNEQPHYSQRYQQLSQVNQQHQLVNQQHQKVSYINNRNAWSTSNDTNTKIDELSNKINKLDSNLNRLIDLNNKYLDQFNNIQTVVERHQHITELQQADISFQHDFTSQFISPICQMIIEVIPMLVKQNTINNNTLLCPSLTNLCDKLAGELSNWTNKFAQTESLKTKLIMNYNNKNQGSPSTNNNNNCNNNISSTSSNNVQQHHLQTSNQ